MKKNIAEILKYCPEGLPLWSPAFGNVELKEATDTRVIIYAGRDHFQLDADGKIFDAGECLLFPSKEQRDWDKFWPYKDGDVLYVKTKECEHVFIYWEQDDEKKVGRYVNLKNRERLLQNPDGYICTRTEAETIRYATEEETDALRRAIEKEGKRWNPAKKELVNIEIVAGEEKAEKFDINKLKPFDRVLARDRDDMRWTGDFFLRKNDTPLLYACVNIPWKQCIPYKGNEALLFTTERPDEYYITWEEEK